MHRPWAVLPWYLPLAFGAITYLVFSNASFVEDMSGDLASFVLEATHQSRYVSFTLIPLLALGAVRIVGFTRSYQVRLRVKNFHLILSMLRNTGIFLFFVFCIQLVAIIAAYAMNLGLGQKMLGRVTPLSTVLILVMSQLLYLALWLAGLIGWAKQFSPLVCLVSVVAWPVVFTLAVAWDMQAPFASTGPLYLLEQGSLSAHGSSLLVAVLWATSPLLLGFRRIPGILRAGRLSPLLGVGILWGGSGWTLISVTKPASLASEEAARWSLRGFYQHPDVFLSGSAMTLFLVLAVTLTGERIDRRLGQLTIPVTLRGGGSARSFALLLGRSALGSLIAALLTVIPFLAALPRYTSPTGLWLMAVSVGLFALGISLTVLISSLGELLGRVVFQRRFLGLWMILVGYFGLGITPVGSWLPWISNSLFADVHTQTISVALLAALCAAGAGLYGLAEPSMRSSILRGNYAIANQI